ncbi:MAG: S-adenosylmethionine:tRNA ribosyltransferase-isomerase [Bacteroidales bacterium]|nr:S-adenosylmethionine:tRNA ribosyltransferase-isomerase [Bacteroidales bacterium]
MSSSDKNRNISVNDYDYALPDERIAYFPADERDNSRLLVYDRASRAIVDSKFSSVPDFLVPGDMLVFNDSRVIHARLPVHNDTGAAIEIFCLEPLRPSDDPAVAFAMTGPVTWKCMVGNARKWKRPLVISVPLGGRTLEVMASRGEAQNATFEVTFSWDDHTITFAEWIEAYGKIPLPPYIRRDSDEHDAIRYQTVYAHHDGSVAAPTAGLHFTDALLEKLAAKGVDVEYVTLHVGAGTFKPVSSDTIGGHFMHEEKMLISKTFVEKLIAHGDRRLVAVGTTVTRTLESLFIIGAKLFLKEPDPFTVGQWEYYDNPQLRLVKKEDSLRAIAEYMDDAGEQVMHAETRLIILPDFKRNVVDGLITNFHQPKSTLLLLVSNFLGDEWRNVYRHALDNSYRFLSYGDANLYL